MESPAEAAGAEGGGAPAAAAAAAPVPEALESEKTEKTAYREYLDQKGKEALLVQKVTSEISVRWAQLAKTAF